MRDIGKKVAPGYNPTFNKIHSKVTVKCPQRINFEIQVTEMSNLLLIY